MLTEKQRRMTKDAMNAAELRAKELCGYLGYNPDDVYLQENLHRVVDGEDGLFDVREGGDDGA
jgi:hypothetical protein